jgi:hypothetical protein
MAIESRTSVVRPPAIDHGGSSLKKVIFRTGYRKDLRSKLKTVKRKKSSAQAGDDEY